ncbi:ArfGap-domain-containing protein [Sistotremastrum niveocremeum HHB9708]|uniref:ArfGap-domain-containing protein n=2 Tax=Sistotremastraceae TaxID=3402574 RepID=A0A164VFG8_9AGAM|nr:ArfGap-domain-containing protein [Sistotremastrum niveocremeum HHB9708]KZT35582.1 ArfGap-domain-containing protein [Sistotremastrum suecicum HHB10207 ss-3]
MSDAQLKKEISDFSKREDLDNKRCFDCGSPHPQWASANNAVFLCIQCAGVHRGFGVHISFVRSVTMDTWKPEELGGNAPFRAFLKEYSPPEQGGYKEGMEAYDLYHSWAATQYREKATLLQGNDWAPSAPPASFSPPSSRPASTSGLRKSRTSTRATGQSGLRRDSASPSPYNSSGSQNASVDNSSGAETANERYFSSLGQANALRPADLPPSQGGKYTGFGNTPEPASQPRSSHPSFGLSSANAPSLSEFQENPTAALSKGWSLFSSVVVGASKAVHENIVQPSVEKVMDPGLHATVKGYVAGAGKKAGEIGYSANEWAKIQTGVDVAGQVNEVVTKVTGGPKARGYEGVAWDGGEESSSRYDPPEEEDFFEQHTRQGEAPPKATAPTSATPTKPKSDGWDEWKDF